MQSFPTFSSFCCIFFSLSSSLIFLFIYFTLSLISGTVSTFAGSGKAGYTDGSGTSAMFNYLFGIAIDQQSGTLFVCEDSNQSIRKVTSNGVYQKHFSLLCAHHQNNIIQFILNYRRSINTCWFSTRIF
jgi:hypothetical protein